MRQDGFKETLSSDRLIRTQNHRIVFSSHQLHTVIINKVSLNAVDDKRYLFHNGIGTRPFGHKNIVHNRIFDEDGNFEFENRRETETTVEASTENAEIADSGSVRNAAMRESDIDSDEIADENYIEEERPDNSHLLTMKR